MGKSTIKRVMSYRHEPLDIIFSKLHAPANRDCTYSKEILTSGSVCCEGGMPLPCDILAEKNIAVTLRDGAVIYTDVYRPADDEKVPGIIAWSPYGKDFPGPPMKTALSGLQKFEAPDPAYWVAHGYAVLNPDARGIGASEDDFRQWGSKQSEDGYDFVQWTAKQEWCSGKVTFAGTSYLAISQWFIAAEQPPALACIAPWEGFSNVYEHSICAGGIPDYEFEKIMFDRTFHGLGDGEDMGAMAEEYPYYNAYWADKKADLSRVKVPAYVVSSYTNKVHSRGTLPSFLAAASEEKWLRIHNTHEWFDFYTHQDDLLKFYDYYMKGTENGWQETPRVRMCVMNPGGEDIVDRPADEYPTDSLQLKCLYLNASDRIMQETVPAGDSEVSYVSDDNEGEVSFRCTFEEKTEIAGTISVNLWVKCKESDDMDIFVMARKLNAAGEELPLLVAGAPYCPPGGKAPFEWGNGRQRVSMRNGFEVPEYVSPGQPVKVTVDLCPMGMLFAAGERLEITIGGYNPAKPEVPGQAPLKTVNKGTHTILCGERYDSALILPIYNN